MNKVKSELTPLLSQYKLTHRRKRKIVELDIHSPFPAKKNKFHVIILRRQLVLWKLSVVCRIKSSLDETLLKFSEARSPKIASILLVLHFCKDFLDAE